MTTPTDEPIVIAPTEVLTPVQRPSRKRQAVAFLVAAVSDFLSFWTVLAPPLQWVIDLVTPVSNPRPSMGALAGLGCGSCPRNGRLPGVDSCGPLSDRL